MRLGICGALGLAIFAWLGKAAAQEKGADPPTSEKSAVSATSSETVTVQATKEVLVEHRADAGAPWKHICSSRRGCAFTPEGGEYRVIGVDVSPSKPFTIRSAGMLKVDIASPPLMRRGEWLLGIGAGVTVVGLIVLFASSAFADPTDTGPNGKIRDEKIGMLIGGSALTFSGLGVGVYGGALYYNNMRSTVTGPIGDVRPRGVGFMVPLAWSF